MSETDRDRNTVTGSNFEQRLQDLRIFVQTFRTSAARDIANSVLTTLQTAWQIEQHPEETMGGRGVERGEPIGRYGYSENNPRRENAR